MISFMDSQSLLLHRKPDPVSHRWIKTVGRRLSSLSKSGAGGRSVEKTARLWRIFDCRFPIVFFGKESQSGSAVTAPGSCPGEAGSIPASATNFGQPDCLSGSARVGGKRKVSQDAQSVSRQCRFESGAISTIASFSNVWNLHWTVKLSIGFLALSAFILTVVLFVFLEGMK